MTFVWFIPLLEHDNGIQLAELIQVAQWIDEYHCSILFDFQIFQIENFADSGLTNF